MFSKIAALLAGVEQTIEHDVEAIIADFNNTVTKLEVAAAAKVKEAEAHMDISARAEALGDAAYAAAEKATKVAGQIKALVS